MKTKTSVYDTKPKNRESIKHQHERVTKMPKFSVCYRCLSLSHRSQGIRTYRNMSYTHLRPSQGREAIRSQILGGSVGNTSSRPINGQHEPPSQAPPRTQAHQLTYVDDSLYLYDDDQRFATNGAS
ncbi:hypothetical protein YC2023_063041 [Brassica napus]